MLEALGQVPTVAGPVLSALVAVVLPLFGLLPLDTTAAPVHPNQGSGFAAYIVGGFFGLGILILFMIWTSRRPKRPS